MIGLDGYRGGGRAVFYRWYSLRGLQLADCPVNIQRLFSTPFP